MMFLFDPVSVFHFFDLNIKFFLGRGNTKEFDESDGNSWTYFVPPKKPLTGKFSFYNEYILLYCSYQKKNEMISSIFAFLLQKYRLGKSQQAETSIDNKQGD